MWGGRVQRLQFAASAGLALLLLPLTTAAQPRPGPAFDLDPPRLGAEAWGDQTVFAAAAGSNGLLAAFFDFEPAIYAPRSEQLMLVAALVKEDVVGPSFVRLPYWSFFVSPVSVAWAGMGFVVVYHDLEGIVAVRVGADGGLVEEAARVLVPGAAEPLGMDLECDEAGRCLLSWSAPGEWVPPTSAALDVVGFGWDEAAGPVHRIAQNDEMWERPAGEVAAAGGGYLVAFSKRSTSLELDPERRLYVQALAATGDPLGDAVELPVGLAWEPPHLARLGDGALLTWRAVVGDEAITRAARLDAAGALVGDVADVHVDPTFVGRVRVSSEGDACAVIDGDGTVHRIDASGAIESSVVMFGRGPEAVAFDGIRHWLIAGYESLWVSHVDLPPAAEPEWSLLSTAPNSQRSFTTAIRPSGAGVGRSLAVWQDNRAGAWEVFAAPFDAGGCPVRAAQPVFEMPMDILGVAADEAGFSVLGGVWDGTSTRVVLRRLLPDGTPAGEGRSIEGLDRFDAIHANVAGGFTLTSGGEARVLSPEGDVMERVPLVSRASDVRGPTALAIEDGVAVISYDGTCGPDGSCTGVAVRVELLDRSGAPRRPATVEPVLGEPAYTIGIRTASVGYVLSWQDGGGWKAGIVSPRGEWSGLSAIDIDGGERVAVTDVIELDGELWWSIARGRSYPSTPGTLSVLRTSTALEVTGDHDLGLVAPLLGTLGSLLPGAGKPTLLGSRHGAVPRHVRIEARRLDGSECGMPAAFEVGPIAAPYDELDPMLGVAGGVPGGGGCGCRTAGGKPRGGSGAVVLLMAGLALAARVAGRVRWCLG